MGQSLLLSHTQLNAIGAPGSTHSWPVTVTNTGAQPQILAVSGRTFGDAEHVQSGSITLTDGTSPQFANYQGLQNNYGTFTFKVPSGQDRLSASIAYPAAAGAGNNARVRLILIDPAGRFAAHSLPQGVGNFGNVDVRQPLAGTWTGVIFGDVASVGGTNGAIPWQVVDAEVRSVCIRLPAGAVPRTGPEPDRACECHDTHDARRLVRLDRSDLHRRRIRPLHRLREQLHSGRVAQHGGRRSWRHFLRHPHGWQRPTQRRGPDQLLRVQGTARPDQHHGQCVTDERSADPVGAYLIGPDGTALGFGQNSLGSTALKSLSAYTLNPAPGTWTLIVDFAEPVVGNEISQPFSGSIKFNDVSVTASGLPNSKSTVLAAGTPVTVPVTITNTGAAPEAYFVDARLNSTTSIRAGKTSTRPTSSAGYALPLTGRWARVDRSDPDLERQGGGQRHSADHVRLRPEPG